MDFLFASLPLPGFSLPLQTLLQILPSSTQHHWLVFAVLGGIDFYCSASLSGLTVDELC